MGKRIYLAILWTITIFCIGLGCYHNNGFNGHFYFGFNGTTSYDNVKDFGTSVERTTEDNGEKGTHIYEQPFTNLVIDCEVADVTIQKGNTLSCDYRIAKRTTYSFDWKPDNEGTAYITLENKKSYNNNGSSFVIYIPSDVNLSSVTIQNDVGDTTLENVSIDTLSINSDVGDIDLNRVTTKNTTLDADTGDVDITNTSFQNLTSTLDVGDCTIDDVDVENYNLDLSADIGDIEVNGDTHRSEYTVNNGLSQTISVSCSVGEIEIN